MKRKLSLRMRLTLLTGAVLAVCAVLLTLGSLQSASIYFPLAIQATPAMPAQSEGTVPAELPSGIAVRGEEILSSVQPGGVTPSVPAQVAYRGFTTTSYIYLIVIIAAGIAAVYFAAGAALRPVKKLGREIKDIGEHNLHTRLPKTSTKDEIGELTDGFNLMMERLDASFNRQKRFTANAAHELKTPLTTIKAGVQVLKMEPGPTPEEYRENADITEQSVERLIGIVDGLFMLASEGEDDISQAMALQPSMEEIINELSLQYQQKNVTVEIKCAGISVMGNPTLIRRVFHNIIENAYKYNRQNGSIAISAKKEDGAVQVSIEDTGIGIPEECLEHIFEPFYRVDPSRSRKIAGSGLGLSIARMILQKHHCTLFVQSMKNEGTAFIITFPK